MGEEVEKVMGMVGKVERMEEEVGKKEGNGVSVKVELQGECFGGIWGD